MSVSRRRFLASSAGISLLSLTNPIKLLASAAKPRPLAGVDGRQNLFMAFNNIRNPEEGESDEYTTLRDVDAMLDSLDVPRGHYIIGTGARTGFAKDPYAAPGEMGYLREYGSPFSPVVTSIKDASATPLGQDDPIMVTQIGVLDPSTAHTFEYDDASRAGTALWTFYNDEATTLGKGMHNTFSDMDGGMLEAIWDNTQAAIKSPQGWASADARKQLQKYMPRLNEDKVWNNLSRSLATPVVHSEWLPYIRKQGWQGAAIILEGEMMNVAQFHIQEWNARAAGDPKVRLGVGKHGALKLQYMQEVRPFITPAPGRWTMVGFLWDLQNGTSTPSMKDYEVFSDLFGQDYHIHGFQDNGSVGGHTHFTMLSEQKLTVRLFPLQFESGKTAFLFNNDLKFDWSSAAQTSKGFRIKVINDGQNNLRNVGVQLATVGLFDSLTNVERLLIPHLRPNQSLEVTFTGKAGMDGKSKRDLWLDRDAHFLEGGQGNKNNRIRFEPKR